MNNLNVLLLDDELSIHDVFKNYFNNVYTIHSAYTYNEAVSLLKSKPDNFFKMFICDINLSGYETGLDFIENYTDSCKSIVMSGYLNKDIIDYLIAKEIFAVFNKPINFGELFICMNSIIRC